MFLDRDFFFICKSTTGICKSQLIFLVWKQVGEVCNRKTLSNSNLSEQLSITTPAPAKRCSPCALPWWQRGDTAQPGGGLQNAEMHLLCHTWVFCSAIPKHFQLGGVTLIAARSCASCHGLQWSPAPESFAVWPRCPVSSKLKIGGGCLGAAQCGGQSKTCSFLTILKHWL